MTSNLLPEKAGWFLDHIDKSIDIVIFGRHTKKDNPELVKAQQLGLKVYTVPEYIYEFALDKQRLVVVGSFGRDIVAAMIVHVLKALKRPVQ